MMNIIDRCTETRPQARTTVSRLTFRASGIPLYSPARENTMKTAFCILTAIMLAVPLFGHIDPKALASQEELLKDRDPKLAANKKLVYDFWREVLEARHLDVAEKYMRTDYIQHNPNAD